MENQKPYVVPDIPADVIQGWHRQKPNHGLSDVIGMDAQKQLLQQELDQKENTASAYFFYGLPGSGKTYLIEGFAHDMMEQGFQFIQLMGSDIHQSLSSVGEKTVQAAFREAIDNAPAILFFDDIDTVCRNRKAANVMAYETQLTAAFLDTLKQTMNAGKRIVFLGATSFPSYVDEALHSLTHMVPVPLPDEAVRAQYFADSKVLGMLSLEDGLTYGYMADQTDNFSFRDLGRLSNAVKWKVTEAARSEHAVLNEDGSVNRDKSDCAAIKALQNGTLTLTRALFDETREANPPSNPAAMRKELEAFDRALKR